MLQAAGNTVVVHGGDEGLELVALKKSISVGISRLEGTVDLCHEALQRLRVSLELSLELLTLCPLFVSEALLPSVLVLDERAQKCHDPFALLLVSALLGWLSTGFDHIDCKKLLQKSNL